MSTGWVVFAVYMLGGLVTARKATFAFRNIESMHYDPGDAEDRIMTRVLGFLIGLVWPAVLVMLLVTWRMPRTDKEVRAKLAEREQHIRDLEREMGIK